MKSNLSELVEISNYYGANSAYVLAGGGNTSYKDKEYLYVKASGTELASITADSFVILERSRLASISSNNYSSNANEREEQVKIDLYRSMANPLQNLRPSVETSLHAAIEYNFIIHTHPTLTCGLLCNTKAAELVKNLFGDNALYVSYSDPGYILFKAVEKEILAYRKSKGYDPKIIFLENHGIIVSANSITEIKSIYADIETKISATVKGPDLSPLPLDDKLAAILPALRMICSDENIKVIRSINNKLIQHFVSDEIYFKQITTAFTPDNIVYCKASPLYIKNTGNADEILKACVSEIDSYKNKYKYYPKVILIKDLGMFAIEDNDRSAGIVLDVMSDALKVAWYAAQMGCPKPLNEKEIAFIDNWEVENYRRKVSKGSGSNAFANKIAIVTGGAQGFGGGIVEQFYNDGVNVIIADLNDTVGEALAQTLNKNIKQNRAVFIKTNVAEPTSVENLINKSVLEFGGLDVFISNAGVLRAGSLDEMEPDTFNFMTSVNYTAYFLCAKYTSKVLKLQSKYNKNYFTDIIQINSKSGLKGSNKNFAYAGGKFGGIGLTQSFAMELMPNNIKVNSICPGNFFEGPLWADPEKGLFVQYLRAGKVPNAKTIDDVKRHYEMQVPAGRGCRVEDVMKAVYYIIGQPYETGQAVPVTGGQEMLR